MLSDHTNTILTTEDWEALKWNLGINQVPFEKLTTLNEPPHKSEHGEVRRAEWHKDDGWRELVALKRNKDSTPDIIDQVLLHELAQPWKNHVIKILGITHDSMTTWMVMELAEYGNLHDYLSNHAGSITIEDKLKLTEDIVSGLYHLHTCGILHGNLHSGNILIDKQKRPRISDFGSTLMASNIAKNIAYSAPEVLKGEVYTWAADVYSFGMIMWQISTNPSRRPFQDVDISQAALCDGIINGLQESSQSSASMPFYYTKLYQNCWEQKPCLRPYAFNICRSLQTHDFDYHFCSENYDGTILPDPTIATGISLSNNIRCLSKAFHQQREWKETSNTPPPLDIFMSVFVGDRRAISWYMDQNPDILNTYDVLWRTPFHYGYAGIYGRSTELFLLEKGANCIISSCGHPLDYTDSEDLFIESEVFSILKGCFYQGIQSKQSKSILSHNFFGRTALHRMATRSANIELMRSLLERGLDVNARDRWGRTALFDVIENGGNLGVLQFLVEQGANVNNVDQAGCTLLHRAAYHNLVKVVQCPVGVKTDISVENNDEHMGVMNYLVRMGADIEAKDNNGWTPLRYAALQGHVETVKWLVENGIDIRFEWRVMHDAAAAGHMNVVRFLLEGGVDINSVDDRRQTALHRATYEGKMESMKCLIEKGANIYAKNIDGCTALCLAVYRYEGHINVVRCLLEKGADINYKDQYGKTMLHRVLEREEYYRYVEMVWYLVEQGADINARDNLGVTALHIAVRTDRIEVVKYLLERGADINAKNDEGWTPLRHAAGLGIMSIVAFLSKMGADVNAMNNGGSRELHWAAKRGHMVMMQSLVEMGAYINARERRMRTALHLASKKGYVEMVQYLLEKGADINIRDVNGCTALKLAAYKCHLEVVKCLVEKGADIHVKNIFGWTAVSWAEYKGCVEMIQYFEKLGARTNVEHEDYFAALINAAQSGDIEMVRHLVEEKDVNVSIDGWIVLQRAAERGQAEVVRYLSEKGADVNVKNEEGETDLLRAAQDGCIEMVWCLLELGADINIKSTGGDTPLLLAACNGHVQVVQCLVEMGADINAKNSLGETALFVAIFYHRVEVVDYLIKLGASAGDYYYEM